MLYQNSLFSTIASSAGFRLSYMEIYNWGTFNEQVFRINPQGNNSLLTGANASGKSTLIDALLTLLVPLKKERFYNQSSGAEKKGDRTEMSYFFGNHASLQEEGAASTTTLRLRDKKSYSIILASFANTDHRVLTFFQVRYFAGDELKTSFGRSSEPLEIATNFIPIFDGNKGLWKKYLDRHFNSNSHKKRIEFFSGPTEYAERIWHTLGMRSAKGLTLFNQIVGVKVLDDLDRFIRANMLEEKDAENEYVQLRDNFQTLMDAKINIDKTKEQITQLQVIDEMITTLITIQTRADKLEKEKETAVYWFAKKKIELAEQALEQGSADLTLLQESLTALREKEETLKIEERHVSIAIEKDEIGNQLKELEKEIKGLEKERDRRKEKLDAYNKMMQCVKWASNPSANTFSNNCKKAKEEKENLEKHVYELNEKLRQIKNEVDNNQAQIDAHTQSIQSLQKHKNNISGVASEIRSLILEKVGATAEEIPFIAELIRVREEEKVWELSIEKILHHFALRLIVPEKYYQQVNQFVNAHNLRGRIVYQRYQNFTSLHTMSSRQLSKNGLFNKIECKPQSKYTEWLEDVIYHHYNYACVNDLSEFNHYKERAVTKEGLIKSMQGKHEKDDRAHVLRRENYVLGWDNKEKIRLLREKIRNLQEAQKQGMRKVEAMEKNIEESNKLKDDFLVLFNHYTRFDDIDWQSYAKIIQEKTRQKTNLEASNDKIKTLQKQLEQIRKNLQITTKEIENKRRAIYQREQKQEQAKKTSADNQKIIAQIGEVDIILFEQENPNLLQVDFDGIEAMQADFQKHNMAERETQTALKNEYKMKVGGLIQKFKNPDEKIKEKFRDWRSDVNALPDPDPERLEFMYAYQSFYKRLVDEDLVRFEKAFNNYFQETITHKVSAFKLFFDHWKHSITETIKHLNHSLKDIDFNHHPTTYIQLVAREKVSDEVSEFKRMLDKTRPNINELEQNVDGRKNHFENHIQPFINRLENETWRKKVMDVRAWLSYKTEEFYTESAQKHKTYESMGQLSGGEKAQLTYTILGAAIAYQFGLTKEGLQSNSFRFIAIDEAFKAQDEDKARYLISLCKQLHLQLLVVTPSDNIHIVENDISYVHYVERRGTESVLYDMPIAQFTEERNKFENL